MDKTFTRTGRISDQGDHNFIPGSASHRLGLVWPLTQEVASLSKHHDVERRLQRDVAVLSRRGR